jgi:translation initiation factor 6
MMFPLSPNAIWQLKEKELLKSVLRVPVEVGTVNCGLPYVKTGLLGNSYGAVAGLLTTGPELFIIESALDLVEQT